ncbi:Fc.00g041730.m01.CDS01 [Cosmosporella sp. VM-42]
MTSGSQVQLIPWDPESTDHVERLVEQRVECGWHHDKVKPVWRGEQTFGIKCIYWITVSPEDPDQDEKLRLHFELYPNDKKPLRDTGASVRGVSRTPTQSQFYPVGHISLDAINPDVKTIELDLPSKDVYWIKTFYVSHALRANGIGRASMDAVESMAVDEPLCARTLALDTLYKEDQNNPEIGLGYYGQIQKMSNQEWYGRRGYRPIKIARDFYVTPDRKGVFWDLRTVFMRKDIS